MIEWMSQNVWLVLIGGCFVGGGFVWLLLWLLAIKPAKAKASKLQYEVDVLMGKIIDVDRNQIHHDEEQQQRPLSDSRMMTDVEAKQLVPPVVDLKPVPKKPTVKLNKKILNDLDALLTLWNDKSLTDKQKKRFEDYCIGKSVKWSLKIISVAEETEGQVWATIVSERDRLGINSAHAIFDATLREKLLSLKGKTVIQVSGVIERFFLAPVLNDCEIISSQ